MKIRGTQTEVKACYFDVSELELFGAVRDLVVKKHPKFTDDYIGDNNIWQIYEGDNHHNGNPEYHDGEVATMEELKMDEFLVELKRVCMGG